MSESSKVRRLLAPLAGVAALVLVVLWMSGVFTAKIQPGRVGLEARRPPVGASTAVVTLETIDVVEEAAGTVQAERRTVVSSRIVAAIRTVHVAAGQAVRRGDLLIELDDRELAARTEEAGRTVEAAAAERKRLIADFERARQLKAQTVISGSEFEAAESAFRVADATLERARRSLEGAEIALTYTRITSPVDGRVVDRLADPGDTATPGMPLLSLYDPSALRIEVPVRESLVQTLHVGDRLQVLLGGRREPIDGNIDEIVPQAEAGSRTFLVKVGLPKRDGLYTGMFGRLVIPAGERERVLVPRAAVQRIGQLELVEVVDASGTLSRRLVTTGRSVGDSSAEVLSGLRPGEVVLLSAAAAVHRSAGVAQ